MICVKCERFHGTEDKHGLCTGCFREDYPGEAAALEAARAKVEREKTSWTNQAKAACATLVPPADLGDLVARGEALFGESDNAIFQAFRDGIREAIRSATGGEGAYPVAAVVVVLSPLNPEWESRFVENIVSFLFGRYAPSSSPQLVMALASLLPALGHAVTPKRLGDVLYANAVDSIQLINDVLDAPDLFPNASVNSTLLKDVKNVNSRRNGGPQAHYTAFEKALKERKKIADRAKREQRKREREQEAQLLGEEEREVVVPTRRRTRRGRRGEEGEEEELVALEDRPRKRAKRKGKEEVVEEDVEVDAGEDAEEEEEEEEEEKGCEELGGTPGRGFVMSMVETTTGVVFDCGMYHDVEQVDHSAHHPSSDANLQIIAKLNASLASWKPSHVKEKWLAFVVRPEEMAARGVDLNAPDRGLAAAIGADIQLTTLETRALADSRKTFFPNRWYYSGTRVDTKALAKIKTATNYVKRIIQKGSGVFVQFSHEPTATFDSVWWIVGIVRDRPGSSVSGSLFCLGIYDWRQDHYHHGSLA